MAMNWLRTVLATLVGIVLAYVLVLAAQYLGNMIDPMVAVADPIDPEAAELQIPLINTLTLFVGWLVGSIGGGWLANRAGQWQWACWIVAGAVIGSAVNRASSLGEEWWVYGAAVALPLIGAMIAGRLAAVSE